MRRVIYILFGLAVLVIFTVLLPINHDKILLRWYGEWRAHVPLMVLLLFTFLLGMASAGVLFAANRLIAIIERRKDRWIPGSHRKALALLREGEEKITRGKEAEAETAIRKAEKMYPGFTKAHEALIRLYLTQNRKIDAAVELEKAVAFDPKNIRLQMKLARLSLETGDTARALKALNDILNTEPYHAPARRLLPAALADAAQWEDAVKAQEALLKNLPKQLAPPEEKNLLAYRTEYARSIAFTDAGKAIKILNEVLKQDPGFLPAALTSAEIHSSKNKLKEAFNTLAEAFGKKPEPFIYERLINMKIEDSLKVAEEIAEEALRENPRRHALRIARVRTRLLNDLPGDALEELSKISGKHSLEPKLLEAAAQLKLGKTDKAAEILQQAIKALNIEYTCSDCGWRFPRWIARCVNCKAFNTMTTPTE